MRCKECSGETFYKWKVIDRWNNKEQKWDKLEGMDSSESIMCGECGSFNIDESK